ncbi:hypothetical protein B0A49_11507, partial [Cryomyces minteri]
MASFMRTSSRLRPCVAQRSIVRPSTRVARGVATTPTNRASAAAAATVSDTYEQPFFPDEPHGPTVRTQIPGPKSVEAIKHLDK